MTRTISRGLAPLVEQLELDQPVVVTVDQLRELVSDARIGSPVHVVAQRLMETGWLMRTGVRGAYEFIPGSHAGRFRHGDPFLVLRAQLAVRPATPGRIALGSALWSHGMTDRPPSPHEISLPPGEHLPSALRRAFRVVRFEPRLPPADDHDLPTDRPTTILVNLADTPAQVRSWADALDALPRLAAATTTETLLAEAADRPHATRVRLAYLLDRVAPDLVDALDVEPTGRVWFGPRQAVRRNVARWNVADTVLPREPGT